MQKISPLFFSSKDQKSKISESESSINSRTCLGHLVLFFYILFLTVFLVNLLLFLPPRFSLCLHVPLSSCGLLYLAAGPVPHWAGFQSAPSSLPPQPDPPGWLQSKFLHFHLHWCAIGSAVLVVPVWRLRTRCLLCKNRWSSSRSKSSSWSDRLLVWCWQRRASWEVARERGILKDSWYQLTLPHR